MQITLSGLAAACAALLLFGGTAQAAFLHPGEHHSFGSDGTVNTSFTSGNGFGTYVDGVAVDEARERLYVFNGIGPEPNDEQVPRLYSFDISEPGVRSPIAGFPSGAPASYRGAQMAVDRSAGGEGAVYVLTEHGTIRSYTSDGTPREGFPVVLPGKPYSLGITVDSKGNVWAADLATATLEEYSPTGAHLNSVSVIQQNNPESLAVDLATDDIFVSGGGTVWRYTAASNYTKGEKVLSEGGPIAYDSRDRVLYVWGYPSVVAYNENYEQIESFPGIREKSSIAVDEATGVVYLSGQVEHPGNEDTQQVAEYPSILVPDAITGEQVGRNAVSGRVELAGGPEVTECNFEYVPEENFHQPQSEVQTVTLEGATGGTFGLTMVENGALTPAQIEEDEKYYSTTQESYGNLTSGSTLIKGVQPYKSLAVGQELIGQGIPAGTTITEFTYGQGGPSTLTMSQPASESITEGTFIATLPFDASAEAVESALGLRHGSTHVTGPAGGPYRVEFAPSNSDLPQLIGQTSSLTPAGAEIAVATIRNGGLGWNTDPTLVPCSPAGPYSSPTDVEAMLTGTSPETRYRYRLAATNANGTGHGVGHLITPHWVDRLETEAASGIERFGATLNGSFEGNGEDTEYHFEWGLGSEYGNSTAAETASGGSGTTTVSSPLSGLQPGTVYHYRIVATNGEGESKGEDKTFETLPAVLDISTDAATGIGPHSATLNASFTGTGEDTTYRFEWGLSTNYGNTTASQDAGTGSEGASNPISTTIPEGLGEQLSPETKYHYRVVATNAEGTSYGGDGELVTAPAVASVTTGEAVLSGLEGLTLHGSFVGNGEQTYYYFEYGLTNSYGAQTAAAPGASAGSPSGPNPTEVSGDVTDFRGSSTYHYRLVATNGQGTTYGADRVFSTLAAQKPDVGPTTVSNVSRTGADLAGSIVPNRWETVYLFEYGTTTSYGSSTLVAGPLPNDFTSHQVSAALAELTPGTLYHVRTVAINLAGTSYGPDQTFTTPDLPRVDASEASGVTTDAAHLSGLVAASGSDTSVQFEYGPTGAYGASTAAVAIGSGLSDQSVEAQLGGLVAGTTYHFRIVATNAIGAVTGPDRTFSTSAVANRPDEKPEAKKCKKGFVKRQGKCVKKKKKQHKKKKKSNGGSHRHA